jgi:alpha-ribazole phosphatase
MARHAPARAQGVCYGRADVATTMPEEEAAEALLMAYPGGRATRVWSSPSRRCRDVAERLSLRMGAALRVDERLHELSFGRWEGLPWSAIEQDDAATFSAWARDWQHAAPPGGETVTELEARVRSFLGDLEDEGEDVLVGHAGPMRAMRVLVEGISWEDAMREPVGHLAWRSLRPPAGSVW